LFLHEVARFGNGRFFKIKGLSHNTAMASFMLGATAGSFICATAKGKDQVHNLHDVFTRGAMPPQPSNYEQHLERARERAEELQVLQRRRTRRAAGESVEEEPDDDDRIQRMRNRLLRRATLEVSVSLKSNVQASTYTTSVVYPHHVQ